MKLTKENAKVGTTYLYAPKYLAKNRYRATVKETYPHHVVLEVRTIEPGVFGPALPYNVSVNYGEEMLDAQD